jgi:hypothetical protein
VEVPARTLATLLDEAGLESVDLLKMDIEGAEWEVFESGLPVYVRALMGEVHGREAEPQALIELLATSMEVEIISLEPGRATFVATRRGAQPSASPP